MTFNNTLPIYHVAYGLDNQIHHLNIYGMLDLIKNNKLTKETYVWRIGMDRWVEAGKVHDLKPLFALPPTIPVALINKNEDDECDKFEELMNTQR